MSKHSGINATRDVLKDQLVLAARVIIRHRQFAKDTERRVRIACVIGFAIGLFVGVAL